MRFALRSVALFLMMTMPVGCGGDGDGKRADGGKNGGRDGQSAAPTEDVNSLVVGKSVAPIAHEKLATLLPTVTEGLNRESVRSHESRVGELVATVAEADYRGDDGAWLWLSIADTGPTTGGIKDGIIAFIGANIDHSTGDGFERSITLLGAPGLAEYRRSDGRGRVRLFVAGRFLVEAKGENVDYGRIERAVALLPAESLVKMRNEGVTK